MITLSDGVTTIELPEGLHWQDEHNWQAVGSSFTRGLTGKPIIQTQQSVKGRPITLVPFSEDSAWWTRFQLASLDTWLNDPDQVLELEFMGTAYDVRFRHYDAPAVEARPIMFYSDPTETNYIQPTLKLVTV